METFTLRRSGRAPLRFTGELLVESSGRHIRGQEQNRWHNIAIYRDGDRRLFAHVAYRTTWAGETDRDDIFDALTVNDLEIELAGYNPTAYVVGYPNSLGDLAKKQAALLARLRARYEEQVGDVLMEVSNTTAG